MTPAKMATPGLSKITVFWNKVMTSYFLSMTSPTQFSWHDSDYIVDVFMWPKFGNSSISMREVITTSLYKDLTGKTAFLKSGLGSSSIITDWH